MRSYLFLFSILFFSKTPSATALPVDLWSDYLRSLEQDAAEQSKIWHFENHKTNSIFNQSKNKAYLNATIGNLFNQERIIQREKLDQNSQLQLIDRGLSKSMELVVKTSASENVVISNLTYRGNNSIAFVKFYVSPNKRFAVVVGSQQGSIDFFNFYVVDLQEKIILSDQLKSHGQDIIWTAPDRFIYADASQISPAEPKAKKVELTLSSELKKSEVPANFRDGLYPIEIFCNDEGKTEAVVNKNDRKVLLKDLSCNSWFDIINASEKSVVIYDHSEPDRILKYNFIEMKNTSDPVFIYTSGFDEVIDHVSVIDDYCFLQTHWGSQEQLKVINEQGIVIQSFIVPQFAHLSEFLVKDKTASLELSLETAAIKEAKFIWNYKTNTLDKPLIEYNLMRNLNVQYVTEVLPIKMRDGVIVPTRITRLSTTKLTTDTPLFIEVYGGFNISGYIAPRFSIVLKDLFLNRGGVYVAPALRGGNEFGKAWNEAGIQFNKMTTYYDVIDVAQYFIKNKFTSAGKIILTGGSNGGLTAAASAFLSPDSFGLVIPVNGVYDLFALPRLDGSVGKWWQQSDFGDTNNLKMAQYVKQYAPLEVQNPSLESLPNFVFVNGLNDSRVNSLHTLKLIKKLRLQLGDTSKIRAVFLKNAGHWVSHPVFQDQIAARETAVLWESVYKQLEW